MSSIQAGDYENGLYVFSSRDNTLNISDYARSISKFLGSNPRLELVSMTALARGQYGIADGVLVAVRDRNQAKKG